MRTIAKSIIIAALAWAVTAPAVLARDSSVITDCYVKKFDSTTTVRADGSLLVEEDILTDCGTLSGKHGIFRIVPEQSKTERGIYKTPVKITSITDENGNPRQYSESRDAVNHTVTYKIGNPNITISGENTYKITYSVANAVRLTTDNKDELYWNLMGNFWEMEIDEFNARVVFPEAIRNGSEVNVYSGAAGEKQNLLADWRWNGDNALEIKSKSPLGARQGITLSVVFTAKAIDAYIPGILDIYGDYLWLAIPLLFFMFACGVWMKHGRDPVLNKTIIPEFEIPDGLPPMQLALLDTNGVFADKMIAASIVDLAVKKHITIEEIKKTWALGKNDYLLSEIAPQGSAIRLTEPESVLLNEIFKTGKPVKISDLKEKFYLSIPTIRRVAVNQLVADGDIANEGLSFKKIFLISGFLILWLMVFFINYGLVAILSVAAAAIILIIFGLIMPKRTPKGAELNWRIQGFKLYMKTAEKYRQQFNEKENIFEKFLPYAMVFGMAKLWIKKMEQLYGKDYFTNYHPAWYTGTTIAGFNANNFVSQIDSLSASIASNTGSSSGGGGGGFSGGGGGGGGGGSW